LLVLCHRRDHPPTQWGFGGRMRARVKGRFGKVREGKAESRFAPQLETRAFPKADPPPQGLEESPRRVLG